MFGSLTTCWNAVVSRSATASMSRPPLDHLDEPPEQVVAVAWAGACLGMVLDAEGWAIGAGKPLVRAVEQADMGDLCGTWQRLRIDGEAVILTSDFYLAGGQVFDRLVRAAVAARHLVGLCSERQAEQLVPEADAEQ